MATKATTTTAAKAPAKSMRLVENPVAPEIYASRAINIQGEGQNVRLTFVSDRADLSKTSGGNCVVVGRVVLPAQQARTLAEHLFNYLETATTAKKPLAS